MKSPNTDPMLKGIVASFLDAITKLDENETAIRNIIETRFADLVSKTGTRVPGSGPRPKRKQVVEEATQEIAALREEGIKTAFRHLRDTLPSEGHTDGRIKIMGQSLATWAAALIEHDKQLIETALKAGLADGEDNSDLAHRVIGSLDQNGTNGSTEQIRRLILRLGKGFLQGRKTRMGGTAPDGRGGKTE